MHAYMHKYTQYKTVGRDDNHLILIELHTKSMSTYSILYHFCVSLSMQYTMQYFAHINKLLNDVAQRNLTINSRTWLNRPGYQGDPPSEINFLHLTVTCYKNNV